MRWDNYHLPQTVSEALLLLAHYDGRARVVGGGTDYFVDDRIANPPVALVDVTRIASARAIHAEDGYIVIGCGVTHAEIERSALVQSHGTALVEACSQIGGPQVRNVATLAGNIAQALPAADGTVALLALGGEALVASLLQEGKGNTDNCVHYEWRPLGQVFRGPGISAIDSTRQVLVAVRFHPTGEHEASAFARVMRPQGVALPIMGLAARIEVEEGIFRCASIALGPVSPTPFRATKTEAFLEKKPCSETVIDAAISMLLGECVPRTSPHRATAEYRREVIPVLFRRAMQAALERCQVVSDGVAG